MAFVYDYIYMHMNHSKKVTVKPGRYTLANRNQTVTRRQTSRRTNIHDGR